MNPWLPYLSALFAGAVAVSVTVAIERFGGRTGGLLGTLPTTIVPAAIGFHGVSQDEASFVVALYATPPGMLLNAGFLACWLWLPRVFRRGASHARLLAVAVTSLALWSAAALVLVAFLPTLRDTVVAPLLCTFALVALGVLALRRAPPATGALRRISASTLVARGALAATAIGASVALARTGNPTLAGVAAVFPAIFLTTMVSLWLSHGETMPTGAAGPMMLGSTSVAAYALFASELMPALGTLLGASLSWLCCALGVTLPLWWATRRWASAPRSP
ncbi:MAG: hypothetical protein ACO3JL_16450 [Myxococcota bacterium]